ncbi:MAG: penicillin acylase family protein [Bacteroidota bacterium]
MRWVKFFISLLFTAAIAIALYFPAGPAPALGDFLNPFRGFWQNAVSQAQQAPLNLSLPALDQDAKVVYDERGVPHIFANSLKDMAYIQGYVTAKDRLWQMEFQVMAAAGRLTEIVGPGPGNRVLEMDRSNRRKGIPFAAEKSSKAMLENPQTKDVMEAYTAGVNAYLQQLEEKDLPIEYKLLGYRPEEWTVYKSALLLKYMANSLAFRVNDIGYTNAIKLWGRERFNILYPEYPYDDKPIIPDPQRIRRRRIKKLSPPAPSDYDPGQMLIAGANTAPDPNEYFVGSNNWAVSGEKTITGRPMLANDPHLNMSLPSIWYEIQVNAPKFNAYGVSLPGAPGVVIGFNDSIAWGMTNAGQDVADLYQVKFTTDKREYYEYDNQTLPVSVREEVHKFKGGGQFVDTLLFTHVGPVMYDRNFGDQSIPLALNWMAHQQSNESLTFLKLGQAKNYEEYVDALTHYQCPAQNFVFADASGNIAIWQQGKYVNKWEEQGRFIMDASRKEHMWNEYIPQDQNPHVLNPPQGFVSSANQHPTSPLYPYYYTGNFDGFRGRRINKLLTEADSVSVRDMQSYQQDTYSNQAADILPTLLENLDTTSLQGEKLAAYQALKGWDYRFDRDKNGPTVYTRWWREVFFGVWEDEFRQSDISLVWPSSTTTIRILRDSALYSFYQNDKDSTRADSVIPDRIYIINQAFHRALGELIEDFPDIADWNWEKHSPTNINHLSRSIAPFSRRNISTAGTGTALNAISGSHGPSWRMVVSLGDKVEAYGIYPGGQSGNPGDPNYDRFIDDWAIGNYYKLNFMQSPQDIEEEKRLYEVSISSGPLKE